MQFGQSSERIEREIEQLELRLEEIETSAADTAPVVPTTPDMPAPDAHCLARTAPES